MKISIDIDIRCEGGPIDTSVAFVKRVAGVVVQHAQDLREKMATILPGGGPPPVLPPRALNPHEIAL